MTTESVPANLDLTIVIPTYNRPRYLRRALGYWEQTGYSVVVADGSQTAYSGAIPANAKYFHDAKMSLARRWASAMLLVNTPYVALCGEDDFLSLSGIANCVEFLRKNLDYVSAQGHSIEFTVDGKDNIHVAVFNGRSVGRHIDADTAKERLKQLFAEYVFQVFSVYRTEMWRLVLDVCEDQKNMNYIELGSAIIPAIFGKHKVLQTFYYARENVPQSATSTSEALRFDIKNAEGLADFEDWKEKLTRVYASTTGASARDAAAIIEQAIADYVNWDTRAYPARRSLKEKAVLPSKYKIRKLVPGPILNLRRSILERIRPRPNIPGYPWSDAVASSEWLNMIGAIRAHA